MNYYKRAEALAKEAGTTLPKLCIAAGITRQAAYMWREGSTPNIATWEKVENAAKKLQRRLEKNSKAA